MTDLAFPNFQWAWAAIFFGIGISTLLGMNLFWFFKRKRKKVDAFVLPKLGDAYHKAEKVVKDLELLGFTLQDTEDWGKMSEEAQKVSKEQVGKFYTNAQFQCTTLRDELMLALQRIPDVRLVRK